MNGKTPNDFRFTPIVLSPVEGLRERFSTTCYRFSIKLVIFS